MIRIRADVVFVIKQLLILLLNDKFVFSLARSLVRSLRLNDVHVRAPALQSQFHLVARALSLSLSRSHSLCVASHIFVVVVCKLVTETKFHDFVVIRQYSFIEQMFECTEH